MRIKIPVEVFYFNQNLNFFENFVESTVVDISFEQTVLLQKQIKVEIRDILNINFSVAFYDAIFCFLNNVSHEKQLYE